MHHISTAKVYQTLLFRVNQMQVIIFHYPLDEEGLFIICLQGAFCSCGNITDTKCVSISEAAANSGNRDKLFFVLFCLSEYLDSALVLQHLKAFCENDTISPTEIQKFNMLVAAPPLLMSPFSFLFCACIIAN